MIGKSILVFNSILFSFVIPMPMITTLSDAHSAGECSPGGKTVDKGAKTHALHLPGGHKGPSDQ